jgi:hypothetical protein
LTSTTPCRPHCSRSATPSRKVREQDKDKPWVAQLVKLYQSDAIRMYVYTEFKRSVLASF